MPKDKMTPLKYAAYFIIVLILVLLSVSRAFEIYELQTFDLRFKIRPPVKVSPDIVIIEIAEDTIKDLGRWPFDRAFHADLINYLGQLGAKAVVFDIQFAEESPSDKYLLEETENASCKVYYPTVLEYKGGKKNGLPYAAKVEVPIMAPLAKASKGVGFINVIPDVDGKVRKVPLKVECGGKEYPQLAYMVAKDNYDLRRKKLPVDGDGMFLINYPGMWTKSFKHYSFSDILVSFESKVGGEAGRISLDGLHGKVCFVGLTETGGVDARANPLETAYPMVGAHASVFNSIIQNKFLVRAGRLANFILLLALCLPIAFFAHKARPLSGLIIFISAVVFFILAGFFLFIVFGLWIDLFCPVVFAISAYLGTTVYKYLVEKRNRLLLDKELSIAKKIQMDFLPQSVPQMENVEVASSIDTAKAVGGDLYDFADFVNIKLVAQKKLGIMIGDVSGKGVPAALFMARAIADFRHFVGDRAKPSEVLDELNKQITLNYKAGLFITMFYMIFDAPSRELVFSNAGHLPAIRVKASGGIDLLKTEGMPLGLIETETYVDDRVKLEPGDSIVLYTDGVTEARNNLKEEFGEERLKEVILKNHYASPLPMINAIKGDLSRFVGNEPQYDDLTIIVLKIKE
jgi:serine phosphatase RsbU (regulator of sigma subunit)/CHASE2 domain-containing sensor protein